LPGLWLSGVQLENDGSVMISGAAIDPKLVPRYLELLTQHASLSSLNSGTVSLERKDSEQPDINFRFSYSANGQGQ
jgi:hypothetical protein